MKINYDLQSAELIDHILSLTDSRSFSYKLNWINELIDIISLHEIKIDNLNVLEVGAGVHNPLGSSVILAAMRANECYCVEPGAIAKSFLNDALICSVLANDFISNKNNNFDMLKAINNLKNNSFDDLIINNSLNINNKVYFFNENLENIEVANNINLTFSNAVLEHVLDFHLFVEKLKKISAPGSLHVHKVDFIDHDYYKLKNPSPIDAFRFLFKDYVSVNQTCNKLRINQMISIFESFGFKVLDIPSRWQLPFPKECLQYLHENFSSCDLSSLETIGAVILLEV